MIMIMIKYLIIVIKYLIIVIMIMIMINPWVPWGPGMSRLLGI